MEMLPFFHGNMSDIYFAAHTIHRIVFHEDIASKMYNRCCLLHPFVQLLLHSEEEPSLCLFYYFFLSLSL